MNNEQLDHNNHHNEGLVPEDDEEEDEDEDDEHEEPDEHIQGHDDVVLDGGDADEESPADFLLFLICSEEIKGHESHPVLQNGTTVQIGLQKSTKLSAVFARYVAFCNQRTDNHHQRIAVEELEFCHVQVLHGNDTAESAALMKNDHIQVRNNRSAQREQEMEAMRLQREADKEYFKQMRSMLTSYSNVTIDCRGTTPVLSTKVKCFGPLVAQRCPWMGKLIQATDEQLLSETEEDHIQVVPQQGEEHSHPNAARIEGEDGEEMLLQSSQANKTIVLNYPPEAVKILLEYCYTNRVHALGMEAFLTSLRTKPDQKKMIGPVPPFPQRRWPNKGEPSITFEVAISALKLADEASLPRLALMCEVAAASLVSTSNVVEALILCNDMKRKSGNGLPRLQKAAMETVLTSRTVMILPSFVNALRENAEALVPTLLSGVSEAIVVPEAEEENTWRDKAFEAFERVDLDDELCRERERRKRRQERGEADPEMEAADRVWKRMSSHTIREATRKRKYDD